MGHQHVFAVEPDSPRPPASALVASASSAPLSPEATIELLARVRGGDRQALDRLLARCLPPLKRWAHGRLPWHVRDMQDTADLVQDTVISALRHLDRFEARHEGALQAYLRQALANRIRDILRKQARRPVQTALPDNVVHQGESPLEEVLGQEKLARYEQALARLRPADRELLIAKLELQYDYEQLAVACNKPSANAARVAVSRALHRLAEELRVGG